MLRTIMTVDCTTQGQTALLTTDTTSLLRHTWLDLQAEVWENAARILFVTIEVSTWLVKFFVQNTQAELHH